MSFTQSIGTLAAARLLPAHEDRLSPPERLRFEPTLTKEEDWEGEEPEEYYDDEADAEAEVVCCEGDGGENDAKSSTETDAGAEKAKRPGIQRLFPHYSVKCVQSDKAPKQKVKRNAYIDIDDDDERAIVRITLSHPVSAEQEIGLVKEATSVALKKYWHSMEPIKNPADMRVDKSDDGLVIVLVFKLKPTTATKCALPRSVLDPRTLSPYLTCPLPA